MPLLDTTGNNTADAYQGGIAVVPTYIEDVFSTYLYTGTGATYTVVNGIDLSTKGGLVWTKMRDQASDNVLLDTIRGQQNFLATNNTNGNNTNGSNLITYNNNGMSLGNLYNLTNSGSPIVTWTFRKQPKFFDVVTYTGTGANTTIAHNLGSVPGCIIVKRTDTYGNWQVYHNGLTSAAYSIQLNSTAAQASATTVWNSTAPTSTVFSVGTDATVNASGGTYVAYIYASNAGGFGLTGTDNVISCGSFTTDGSGNATVNLGYEPQWVIIKPTADTGNTFINAWNMYDVMRGWPVSGTEAILQANSANAETVTGAKAYPSSTGINYVNGVASNTFIYIAIRRGPMKVPTDATTVFNPTAFSGNGSSGSYTNNFPTDMIWHQTRNNTLGINRFDYDRLRAINLRLYLNTNDAEAGATFYTINNQQNLVSYIGNASGYNASGETYIDYSFRRAPSFFDEVCYTGTGGATTQKHNLGVIPELIIIKNRDSYGNWPCYNSTLGATNFIYLNDSGAYGTTSAFWGNTTPTSSVFSLGSGNANVNTASVNYVAYLFATCAGVSKVGSYTGNGTTQAIACGFSGGARFVLIKRTDSTGDWYVYDTARGMTTLTDPYLLLNGTTAETATLGSVTTTTGGFTVNAAILAAINTSSATYIFLAIA